MEDKQIEVFAGSPWEVAAVSNILTAAHIENHVNDWRTMTISVPFEEYVMASQLVDNRF
jgi:hypothetical protein